MTRSLFQMKLMRWIQRNGNKVKKKEEKHNENQCEWFELQQVILYRHFFSINFRKWEKQLIYNNYIIKMRNNRKVKDCWWQNDGFLDPRKNKNRE